MSRYGRVLGAVISLLTSTYGLGANHAAVPRFAYVANNQDDTVSIFTIEKARLRSAGYVYAGAGSNPRAVVVTPSQTYGRCQHGGFDSDSDGSWWESDLGGN
jgi:hypothetical protein